MLTALGVLLVVFASSAAPALATHNFTAVSVDDVDTGQPSAAQSLVFGVDLGANNVESATITVGAADGLPANVAVESASFVSTDSDEVNVTYDGLNGGNPQFTVANNTSVSGAPGLVQVTTQLTLNTSQADTGSAVTYTLSWPSESATASASFDIFDVTSPEITSTAYEDADADGTVDTLRVRYSEDVDASTFVDDDWTITTAGDPGVASPTNVRIGATNDEVLIDVAATADVTGPTTTSSTNPVVAYAGTSVVDAAGNQAPGDSNTVTDVADPVVKTVSSVDADGDGQVDRLDVTFTEQISNSQSSGASAADFTIGGTDADSVTKGNLTVPGDGPTVQLAVTGPADDTALSLTADYSASTIRRNGANIAKQFSGETVDDGAAPLVTDATTLDRDGDGDVDAANLTFTEALSDATVTASEFSLDGNAADAFDTLSTADDETLQVRITTDGNEVSGTGAVDVTHTSGTTADAAGNTLGNVAAGDVSETDGAAPVVSGFSLTADDENGELDVSFDASESLSTVSVSITGPESATLSSFSTSGTTYTASTDVSTDGDYTATLDTADDAAGNSAASTPSDTVTVSLVTTPTPTPVPTAEPNTGGGGGNAAPSALSGTASKVRVSGSTGLSEVGVNFGSAAGGTIRATEVNSLGENSPPGTFVTAADITVPESFTETASTLKFAISRDRLGELGVDASALTVYRLHDGSWDALETRVVDRGDDRIVVEADTPGFSRFAVMAGETTGSTSTAATSSRASDGTSTSDDAADAGGRSDSASTEENENAGDTQLETGSTAAETTASQTPGFGVGVALVSLLAFLVVARRRLD